MPWPMQTAFIFSVMYTIVGLDSYLIGASLRGLLSSFLPIEVTSNGVFVFLSLFFAIVTVYQEVSGELGDIFSKPSIVICSILGLNRITPSIDARPAVKPWMIDNPISRRICMAVLVVVISIIVTHFPMLPEYIERGQVLNDGDGIGSCQFFPGLFQCDPKYIKVSSSRVACYRGVYRMDEGDNHELCGVYYSGHKNDNISVLFTSGVQVFDRNRNEIVQELPYISSSNRQRMYMTINGDGEIEVI